MLLETREDGVRDGGVPLSLTNDEKKRFLTALNIGLLLLGIVFLGLLVAACMAAQSTNHAVWWLLVVAAAGSGAGSVAGFIYASYGNETERFKPLTNLINGFVGGASVADLGRGSSSVILGGLRSISLSCGLGSGGALIACLLVGFASIGFISMYCNRRLLFNSLMAEQDKRLEELSKAVGMIVGARISAPGVPPDAGAGPSPGGGGGGPSPGGSIGGPDRGGPGLAVTDRPSLPSVVREAAVKIGKLAIDEVTTTKGMIAWAKAKLAEGSYADAVRGFRNALQVAPHDPELLLGYGLALFYSGTADRRAGIAALRLALENTTRKTNKEVVKNIYKALTYCYLYQPGGYADTITLGEKYISDPSLPVSGGIFTNLAAAYGQKYAALPKNAPDADARAKETRAKALEYMTKAIALDPSWITLFQSLLIHDYPGKSPEENDLESFEDDREFRDALLLP